MSKKLSESHDHRRSGTNKSLKEFSITVFLAPIKHKFVVDKVKRDMLISELKAILELLTGIPSDVQRLSYLDESDLLDSTNIKANDIVPGATLDMKVWDMWTDLLIAVTHNDLINVILQGVTEESDYFTPNIERMSKHDRQLFLAKRAEFALMVAARFNLNNIVNFLIEKGANINGQTSHGRTALHIAAAQGNAKIVNTLLGKGANVDIQDLNGKTALAIADMFDQKVCGRYLFTHRWTQRAQAVKPSIEPPLKEHHLHNSTMRVGFKGRELQIYRAKLGPPEEFDSTAINARKHDPFSNSLYHKGNTQVFVDSQPVTYDEWIKKKMERNRRLKELEEKIERESLLAEDSATEMLEEFVAELTQLQKAESYENWLRKQQQTLTFDTGPSVISNIPSAKTKGIGYLRHYLKSLMEQNNRVMSNPWVAYKGLDILDSMEYRPPSVKMVADTKVIEKVATPTVISRTSQVS